MTVWEYKINGELKSISEPIADVRDNLEVTIPKGVYEEAQQILPGADKLKWGVQFFDNDPRRCVNLYLLRTKDEKLQVISGAVYGICNDEEKCKKDILMLGMNENRLTELICSFLETKRLSETKALV